MALTDVISAKATPNCGRGPVGAAGAERGMRKPQPKAFRDAQDAVVVYGSEGMGQAESAALAEACANLLVATRHAGRANNGLLGVWP